MGAVADFRAAASVLLDRFRFFNQAGITFGGRRDLYQILGYRRVLTYTDYYDRYARGGIAKAIVEAYPEATWRGGVEVYEDEDPQTDTEFEKAFKDLDQRLNFWQRLQQADTLAGLSTFAILLIGNSDADLTTELSRGGEVKFLKPFSGGGGPLGLNRTIGSNRSAAFDAATSVAQYDTDPTSERYGEPLLYDIRAGGSNTQLVGKRVHWTRVIHVAEGCLEDDVFGVPVLESIWNLLDDLDKVTGGGSESFWLRANQGLHLDVDKDLGFPSKVTDAQSQVPGMTQTQRDALRDAAEEMQHQLQRVLVTRGVTANQLGSDVANFAASADAILKQIAGSKKIPMRILTGSEMGTLASEQDAANFDSRVQDRRTGYAGPRLVRRTIDRLIKYGYLPTPKQYEVGWPVEENMDEAGKAAYALSLANVNRTQDSLVFTDDEIRDMAFDKSPLKGLTSSDELSESQKAEIAARLATANRFMGVTLFTDDEIRNISYGFKPLTPDQKQPIAMPIREIGSVSNAANPDNAQMTPEQIAALPPVKPRGAEQALLRALETAIEADDLGAIGRLLGLQDGPHTFSTTQVQLPESFLGFGQQIPDADLDAQGRETDPHVTLKYGLRTQDPDVVRQLLAGRGPITLTLGKLNHFTAEGYDVLYAEVRSADLEQLNALISRTLDVVDTQPSYIPHATIAYLKPGIGARYDGVDVFEGQQHIVSDVVFSDAAGERTVLHVSGM